jgi:hypothetical protein
MSGINNLPEFMEFGFASIKELKPLILFQTNK